MSVNYLRVSVTDRCNLRCVYCHPLCGCDYLDRREILRLEEIHRIVRLFAKCGVRKVRLTGGEPLVRKNIIYLIRNIAAIKEVEDISLTTNGVFLDSLAEQLKAAGLHRVNISVDSAERKSFKEITGYDFLPRVTEGIRKAIEIGLNPVKINSVLIRGINVSQIIPLARISMHLPVSVRFIEYCPTSKYTRPASDFVPAGEVREIIENEFGFLAEVPSGDTDGPASCFKIKYAAGTIGFISGRSSVFCKSCNRIRITSDGRIKPCLYSSRYYDIKDLMRKGAQDGGLLEFINRILNEKHSFTRYNSAAEEFNMQEIGG